MELNKMNLGEIFNSDGEFMDWLANNCYSCEKLGDGTTQYNPPMGTKFSWILNLL